MNNDGFGHRLGDSPIIFPSDAVTNFSLRQTTSLMKLVLHKKSYITFFSHVLIGTKTQIMDENFHRSVHLLLVVGESIVVLNNRDRRDHYFTILMFKTIHGITPTHLSGRIVMNLYVNGNDTRGCDMDLYFPTLRKEACQNSFIYKWQTVEWSEFVHNSTNVESFKHNYRVYKRINSSCQNRY